MLFCCQEKQMKENRCRWRLALTLMRSLLPSLLFFGRLIIVILICDASRVLLCSPSSLLMKMLLFLWIIDCLPRVSFSLCTVSRNTSRCVQWTFRNHWWYLSSLFVLLSGWEWCTILFVLHTSIAFGSRKNRSEDPNVFLVLLQVLWEDEKGSVSRLELCSESTHGMDILIITVSFFQVLF
jgi:hypothetical protein